MSKKALGITAAALGLAAVLCLVWFTFNAAELGHKAAASMATSDAPQVTKWDSIWTALSGLLGGGLTLGGIITAVIAFLKTSTEAAVDKVLPNASVDTKARAVDVTTIASIQVALTLAKDADTRKNLIVAGRAAFQDLCDRTFPLPVEVTP